MRGIVIRDTRDNFLDFDLRDVVDQLGDRARTSWWLIDDFEASSWPDGPSTNAMMDAVYAAQPLGVLLDGSEFEELAATVFQTIDGEFRAYHHRPGEAERAGLRNSTFTESGSWLIVRIVDSFYVELIGDEDVIAEFEARCRDVTPIDLEAYERELAEAAEQAGPSPPDGDGELEAYADRIGRAGRDYVNRAPDRGSPP